jgi:hypothetical protein
MAALCSGNSSIQDTFSEVQKGLGLVEEEAETLDRRVSPCAPSPEFLARFLPSRSDPLPQTRILARNARMR